MRSGSDPAVPARIGLAYAKPGPGDGQFKSRANRPSHTRYRPVRRRGDASTALTVLAPQIAEYPLTGHKHRQFGNLPTTGNFAAAASSRRRVPSAAS
jgi:hypothetical protein